MIRFDYCSTIASGLAKSVDFQVGMNKLKSLYAKERSG